MDILKIVVLKGSDLKPVLFIIFRRREMLNKKA